ncbi:CAAX prenyl protease 2 isoform X2 [Parasteatoda tepidariorum]|uniref:CAAX prenyl protease 2 isoform X2 n=1 Tax=Parasteatoda tepidariorum TaxID=114398 RepID=UPI001C721E7F|nr:CAAX prenyl protease 2 isoform X2 [Parasteatoda tepidariorum]
MNFSNEHYLGCFSNVMICILLACIYVGSLYIWPNTHGRDHPSTIKRRFLSVFIISFFSAVVVYIFADRSYFGYDVSYWSLVGIQASGLLQAIIIPLFLTMVLFLGPLSLHYNDGQYNTFFDFKVWIHCLTNVIWLRNHVIAPIFEEFTFRACMLPILVPCFGNKTSVILCPLFFGIVFQLAYTTVFGAYSSFLFLRTGHFAAPSVAHAFCNHMGFPDFGQLLALDQPKQSIIMMCFVVGLFLWIILLKPLTDPELYGNSVYWPVML